LWLAGVAHAEATSAGVFPVAGTNLSAGEADAIGQLMAQAYAAQTQRVVLGPAALAESLQRTRSERDSARELGLSEYIHVDAVRLTTRIAIYASLHNQYGTTLYEVRATAYSLDDMQVVAERVAASLRRRTPIENTRTLDNITLREASAHNRVFLEKIFGARFGVVAPFARHLENQASLLLQFDARLEKPEYFLELSAGFWLPSRTNSHDGLGGFVGQLGGSYYLAHTSVSPYIGLGISPRAYLGQYEGAGLAINAQVGVMFLRESSTRLYAELRVDQNLIQVKPSIDEYEADGVQNSVHAVLPTECSFAVGLGF
jgi:hypothetical protein